MPEHTTASRLRLSGLCFLLQILTIILFAVFVRYSPEGSPSLCSQQLNCSWKNQDSGFQHPRFRDVHLQALLGFGLLVAFLSRYGLGSTAISILIVAFAIQWAVLIQGFLYFFLNGKIYVGAQSMVSADFCTAAILISTGAVLGRGNPVQMLLLTLLGVTLFTLNEYILLSLMGVSDSGGSLTVHTFGAYFGLMVSRILHQPHTDKRKEQQDTGHQPDVFAVVGTIYLWIFWPSFTSATTVRHNTEPWAVLNTYFSLAASTLATFVLLPVLYEESTLQMVQIQDATLASVAMMGMAGEMLVTPFGALIAGFLAGLIPPLGFRFLTPVLRSRLKTQDTCGVHNVHGLPGILGALLGTLLTALATADAYGGRLELVFPLVAQGSRTATDQALCQLCALPITLLLATLGGFLTGGRGRMRPRGEQKGAGYQHLGLTTPTPPVRSCTTRLDLLPASPVPGSCWQPDLPSSQACPRVEPGPGPKGFGSSRVPTGLRRVKRCCSDTGACCWSEPTCSRDTSACPDLARPLSLSALCLSFPIYCSRKTGRRWGEAVSGTGHTRLHRKQQRLSTDTFAHNY
ncbi:ammonium transporter Rh type B isoform X1 [Grus americana]|uniref:ammonium transporter Rh type B isoform X1 n=1 Tax=Grus americana TaxID=9117 RepID=UPI0024083935|nr:ammonium transporter Rh type B isoform X1 [Grus americana]